MKKKQFANSIRLSHRHSLSAALAIMLVTAMLFTGCSLFETASPSTTPPQHSGPIQTQPTQTDPAPTGSSTSVNPTVPSEPTVPTEPTVPDAIPVESITLSAPKTTIRVMEKLPITADILPQNADVRTVIFHATGGQMLETGVFFAEKPGVYVITAYAMDNPGVTGTITVTVEATPVTGITITGENTVSVGGTLQLSAQVLPEDATDSGITWSIISGEKFATIDENGVLTAIAPGTVTVQAAAKDGSGITATFTVKVEEAALWEGSGTEKDPFLITCLEDLLNLQKVVSKSGYYYRQVADIDCASVDNWIVIGDENTPFRHHYDGGGYTISNLCFDGDAHALFSQAEDSHFKNMKILNAHTQDNHQTMENYSTALCPSMNMWRISPKNSFWISLFSKAGTLKIYGS